MNPSMDLLALTKNKKLMGLDVGTKTIGLAISDALHLTANPLITIERKSWSQDSAQLAHYIQQERAGFLVIGLPLNMDGSKGPRSQSTQQFARNIEKHPSLSHIPFTLWDERLSTAGAYRQLEEFDISHSKISEKIDSQAAAFLLEGFLGHLRHLKGNH
jgi:putative Holliday junction resolvase